jgi:hypothetical protein
LIYFYEMEPVLIKENPTDGIGRLEIFPSIKFDGETIYPLLLDGRTHVTAKIGGVWLAEALKDEICNFVGSLIEIHKL